MGLHLIKQPLAATGQGCGVGTVSFDAFNRAGAWVVNVTGDPAEATLGEDTASFKLNPGSVDSTFVMTQLRFRIVTGGDYIAFNIPKLEFFGFEGSLNDECRFTLRYSIDADQPTPTWTDLLTDEFIDTNQFTDPHGPFWYRAVSLPIVVVDGMAFGIQIEFHLTSTDANQPHALLTGIPESYCCDGIPIEPSNLDSLDDEGNLCHPPFFGTDPPLVQTGCFIQRLTYNSENCPYDHELPDPPEDAQFVATPTSWAMYAGSPPNPGSSAEVGLWYSVPPEGIAFNDEQLACLVDLDLCRSFIFECDVDSGDVSGLPDGCTPGVAVQLLAYDREGERETIGWLHEDGTFSVDLYYMLSFAGHVTSVLVDNNRWRYLSYDVLIGPCVGQTATFSNPKFTPSPVSNSWLFDMRNA